MSKMQILGVEKSRLSDDEVPLFAVVLLRMRRSDLSSWKMLKEEHNKPSFKRPSTPLIPAILLLFIFFTSSLYLSRTSLFINLAGDWGLLPKN